MNCSKSLASTHLLLLILVFAFSSSRANEILSGPQNSDVLSRSLHMPVRNHEFISNLNFSASINVLDCNDRTCTKQNLFRGNEVNSNVNKSRRNLLLSTGAIGVIGAGFVAVPFLKSWLPSERAKAFGGPVKANISKLEAGQMISIQWRGQPVFIVNRTDEQTEVLNSLTKRLKDPSSGSSIQPKYINNIFRARKDNMFVVIGVCTHLGCVPKYYPELVSQQFDKEWKGGFFCPCHNSRFDISGRVFNGSPASRNLDIPPHMYLDEHTIEIGNDEEQA